VADAVTSEAIVAVIAAGVAVDVADVASRSMTQ